MYSRTSNSSVSGVQSPQNIRGVPLEDSTQYDPETKEGGLFVSYINTFLKYKLEASGPSDWIKTPEVTKEYIDPYFEKEGMSLDSEKIKTSSPKGNDRPPEKKQVFLNRSLVIKRFFFQLVKGSQLCSPWLTKFSIQSRVVTQLQICKK